MTTKSKVCSKCKISKSIKDFYRNKNTKDGRSLQCKECASKYQKSTNGRIASKKYSRSKKGRISQKRCYNSEKGQKYIKKYHQTNEYKNTLKRYNKSQKRKEVKKRYYQKNKLSYCVALAIRRSFKGGKKEYGIFRNLDYTVDELKNHLEKQFKDGMNWDNRGEWHIDHIKPISSFNFKSVDDDDFKKCWSLDNLQPLWAQDNLKKAASF